MNTKSSQKHQNNIFRTPSKQFNKNHKQSNPSSTKNLSKNTPKTSSQIHYNQSQSISPVDLNKNNFNNLYLLPNNQSQLSTLINKKSLKISKRGRKKKISHNNNQININNQYKCFSKPQLSIDNQLFQHSNLSSNCQQKKVDNSLSVQCQDYNTSSFPILSLSKRRSSLHFSFDSYKKSYRKISSKKNLQFIPFRKNQDPIESKIISIINKLIHEKFCKKQILCLAQKMIKLQSRQLLNKSIISGFQSILKLVQNNKYQQKITEINQTFDQELLFKLKKVQQKLQKIIEEELNDCQQFQFQYKMPQVGDKIISNFMVRKIYNILKKVNGKKYLNQKLKDSAIKLHQQFAKKDNFQLKNVIKFLQTVQSQSFEQIVK